MKKPEPSPYGNCSSCCGARIELDVYNQETWKRTLICSKCDGLCTAVVRTEPIENSFTMPSKAKSYLETIGKLQDEIVGLRKALEFYATAWMQNQNGSLDGTPSKGLIADRGMKAKKALSPTP